MKLVSCKYPCVLGIQTEYETHTEGIEAFQFAFTFFFVLYRLILWNLLRDIILLKKCIIKKADNITGLD